MNRRAELPGALFDVGLVCERHGEEPCTNIHQRFVSHSPDGFEWGYGGSGPADLGLNVLAQLVPLGADKARGWKIHDRQQISATAGLLHNEFKSQFLAGMPKEGGRIPIAAIRRWLEERQADPEFRAMLAIYQDQEEGEPS